MIKFIYLYIGLTLISPTLGFLHALEFDHKYIDYKKLLNVHHKKTGNQTLINYKKIKKNPKLINKILINFSSITKKQYGLFTKKQQLAFLINSYNVFTVKLIIDNYPVKSIKDIGSLFTSSWKKKFFTFLGEKTYLDHIEHDLIRKQFNEPRIHFAVVCASIGCPNLQRTPFTSDKLEQQLEKSALDFLKDSSKNSYDSKKSKLKISKIFKWYGDDFKGKYSSYLNFIARRITKDKVQQEKIIKKKAKSSWNDYNWELNQW